MEDVTDPLLFALTLLRITVPCLASIIFCGSRLKESLNAYYKKFNKEAYAAIPSENALPVQTPDALSNPNEEEGDAIVPVVQKRVELRQTLIIMLYANVGLSLICLDGGIFVVRALTKQQWESELPLYHYELLYFLLLGFNYVACSLAFSYDRRHEKPKLSWKSRYPVILVIETLLGEIALVTVFSVYLRKQRPLKPDIFAVLHLASAALRILLLIMALLSFTRLLKRIRFIAAKHSNGYGTFGAENGMKNTAGLEVMDSSQPPNITLAVIFERVKILFPYLWPKNNRSLQGIALICVLLLATGRLVNLLVPIFIGRLVETMGAADPSMWMNLAVFIGLKFCQGSGGILQVAQSNLWIPISQYSDREMSLMAFNHLLNLSMSYHTRRKTGEVLRVLDRGSAINSFFQMLLFQVFPIFCDVIIAVGFLAHRFGLTLSSIVFGVMCLYVFISVYLTRQRTQYRRQMNEADKHCRAIHTDALMSVESVKYFVAEAWESNRYREAMRAYQKEELKVLMSLNFLNLCQNLVLTCGLMLGSLVIAFQVAAGRRNVSDFITYLTYSQQLSGPLNVLGTLYRVINQNVVDTESLLKLLQEPKEIEDLPDAQELIIEKGEIELKNVTFSYDGKVKALDNISLKIPAGASVAFVGPSGSGKSTLFRLLFRFYEVTEGSILVDGMDIRTVTQESLRNAIGVVPQDAVLFNESIFYNIHYSKPKATDAEVFQAAKHAQIYDRITSFPEGFDTKVGERGVRLSGGEKQRVSIARVMLKDPSILMLDEASSSLDTTTEREIQKSLHSLQQGRTALVIAHRLSTITSCDLIFCLKDGKIQEKGTFGELLSAGGLFAELWQKSIDAEENVLQQEDELPVAG